MEIKLQKYLTSAGVTSRRKVDELIASGRISVNGVIINEFGVKVKTDDIIRMDGIVIDEPIKEKTYIALNKPTGVLTTVYDPQGRPTVMDYVPSDVRLFPVGRLDYDSSGLLLLTNDGDWTYKLTHPKHETTKTYIASVRGHPSNEALNKLRRGVYIEGRRTSPCKVEVFLNQPNKLSITIHEGRNRQIRKMLENVGHPVTSLIRTAIGSLELGDLPRGQWRYLTEREVSECAQVRSSNP